MSTIIEDVSKYKCSPGLVKNDSNECEPLLCPVNSSLTEDPNGQIGCKDDINNSLLLCPDGFNYFREGSNNELKCYSRFALGTPWNPDAVTCADGYAVVSENNEGGFYSKVKYSCQKTESSVNNTISSSSVEKVLHLVDVPENSIVPAGPPGPNYECPSGTYAPTLNDTCMPLVCPSYSTMKKDEETGAIGCNDDNTNNFVVCPYGFVYTLQDGNLSCMAPSADTATCQTGYNAVGLSNGTYTCQKTESPVNNTISSSSNESPLLDNTSTTSPLDDTSPLGNTSTTSSLGDNNEECPTGYAKNNNTNACQYVPFTCPNSADKQGYITFDDFNNPSCILQNEQEGMGVMCPIGSAYVIDESNLLTCLVNPNNIRVKCPSTNDPLAMYVLTPDKNGNPICLPISNQSSSNESSLLGDTSTTSSLGDTSTTSSLGDTSTTSSLGDTSTPPPVDNNNEECSIGSVKNPYTGVCQYVPFTCPNSARGQGLVVFDEENIPSCFINGQGLMCPAGFEYSIDSSDLLTCKEKTNYFDTDKGNCPSTKYVSIADSNGNPMCIANVNQTSSNEPPLFSDTTTLPTFGDPTTPPFGDPTTPPLEDILLPTPVGDTSTPPQEPTIKTVVCPNGYTYSSMINGIMSCSKENQVSVSLECPTGYTYNGSTTEGGMICAPLQQFTSHVYEFKSKRGRTVETFSQNRNGKCKARY